MVLVESRLNNEQVSLTRPIYIEMRILVQKLVVLIVRVVLTSSGLYIGTLLYKFYLRNKEGNLIKGEHRSKYVTPPNKHLLTLIIESIGWKAHN